jgi:hypothetical protein
VNDLGDLSDNMRRLVLERTRRLLELDEALRSQGQPGVLQRREDELPLLEQEVLGTSPAAGPPGPNALTDDERRLWVRRHLRVLPGGLDVAAVPTI